jgi:hypothetical protein
VRTTKVAFLGYAMAAGFILAVAFHSSAKLTLVADDPPPKASSVR